MDQWLSQFEECSQMGHEILVKINERDKHSRTSVSYTKLSAQIRASMKKFSNDIAQLKMNLIRLSTAYRITEGEMERRQILVNELISKEKKLNQAFNNEGAAGSRQNLMGHTSSSLPSTMPSNPWLDEPEEFRGLANQDIRTQQQNLIEQQDEGLDALSKVISHQKQMAVDIGHEVDAQNEIIDDIGEHMDRTNERLIKERRHIKIVDKKSATCWYWMIILLLFVAIIVVAALPRSK